jgi:hypothetical protein
MKIPKNHPDRRVLLEMQREMPEIVALLKDTDSRLEPIIKEVTRNAARSGMSEEHCYYAMTLYGLKFMMEFAKLAGIEKREALKTIRTLWDWE